MKTTLSDQDYREILESTDVESLNDLAAHSLMDFIKIDLLLEQIPEYPNYIGNIFDEDWDDEVNEEIKAKVKSGLEAMDEDELNSFFRHFAYKHNVIEELMQLTDENREFVVENL